MDWQTIGSLVVVFLSVAGLNLGAMQWLLSRQDEQKRSESCRSAELEKEFFELRAALPLEYVRREDWIRFTATLDSKLDAMRVEMREEMALLKERLYAGRD